MKVLGKRILIPCTGLLLAACGGSSDSAATGPVPRFLVVSSPGNGVADFEEFEVCKFGSAGNFDHTVTPRPGGPPQNGSLSLNDGECTVIALFGGLGADVSVTETGAATGFQLDHVDVTVVTGTRASPVHTTTTVSGPTVVDFISGSAGGGLRGVIAKFYNVPTPLSGGEGCTPGYWKQNHHFDSWPAAYTPNQQFSGVFENAFPGKTLVQVLAQGGGGLKALGRHTVAALLNAASAGVDYDLTTTQVINAFNGVFPGGDYEGQKNIFARFNEQGCPLN